METYTLHCTKDYYATFECEGHFKICCFDGKKKEKQISGNYHGLEGATGQNFFFFFFLNTGLFTENPCMQTTVSFSCYIWFNSFS